jgi:hypothetical protein
VNVRSVGVRDRLMVSRSWMRKEQERAAIECTQLAAAAVETDIDLSYWSLRDHHPSRETILHAFAPPDAWMRNFANFKSALLVFSLGCRSCATAIITRNGCSLRCSLPSGFTFGHRCDLQTGLYELDEPQDHTPLNSITVLVIITLFVLRFIAECRPAAIDGLVVLEQLEVFGRKADIAALVVAALTKVEPVERDVFENDARIFGSFGWLEPPHPQCLAGLRTELENCDEAAAFDRNSKFVHELTVGDGRSIQVDVDNVLHYFNCVVSITIHFCLASAGYRGLTMLCNAVEAFNERSQVESDCFQLGVLQEHLTGACVELTGVNNVMLRGD